jgi:DNA sulfur modification protein DndD
MELKIISWESKGLRCPDGKIILNENGFKRFNFIQMPNATGKTTYLELIQYALSGFLIYKDGITIGDYFDISNKSSDPYFELIVDSNSQIITFRIDFEFDVEAIINKSKNNNSKAKYSTSYAGIGGLKPGHLPPNSMKKMLTDEFVKLFVFDGEFANKLFDPADSRAFQCLDSICQLNILDKMEQSLDKYWKNQIIESEKSSSAKTKIGIALAIKEKDKYEAKKLELEEKLSNGEKEIQRILKEITNIDKEIKDDDSLSGNLKNLVQEKKEICEKLENEYNLFIKDYFDLIKNPINLDQKFIEALDIVQDSLYKLKIPANATRAFFDELVEDKNCICDREMNNQAIISINKNKVKYFDEDRAGIYNSLKTDIRNKLKSKDFDKNILAKKNEEFKRLKEARESAEFDYELANKNLQLSAPTNLAQKMEKRGKLNNEKNNIFKELEEIRNNTDENLDKTKSITILNKAIKKQEEKILQIEENMQLTNDIKIIKDICKKIKVNVKKAVKQKIIETCNLQLKNIFTGEKKLQIEDIEEYITLENQSSGSEGQKLTVGILYLSVLLARENVNFFTIFDSPCGKIDLHVRRDLSDPLLELVKKNGQFITFVQSSERLDFTTAIENKVNANEILHLTIFDKSRFSSKDLPNLPTNKIETKNAFFINDKDFFNNFRPLLEIKNNI